MLTISNNKVSSISVGVNLLQKHIFWGHFVTLLSESLDLSDDEVEEKIKGMLCGTYQNSCASNSVTFWGYLGTAVINLLCSSTVFRIC